MRSRRGARLCGSVCFVLLLAFVPTAGAAKPITGKLSAPENTVIALDADGGATSAQAKPNGKFKVEPTAKRVSLHLRSVDGTYAGPIVIQKKGKTGKKAILGVEAGAELGKVRVGDGLAKLKHELPREDQDRTRKALAVKGVPIGAGNFGRVAAAATGLTGPGQDQDLDGIPGALDIDDDGDLVLDDVDTAAAGSTIRPHEGAHGLSATTALYLGAGPASTAIVNANAPGLDDEQIQSGLRARGTLTIGGIPFASAELDCAGDPSATPPRPGLSYCWAGGTGTLDPGGNPGLLDPNPQPFPACCDPDGNGFGSLGPGPLLLQHGAGADEIRGGDPLVVRNTTGVGEPEAIDSLATVLATVPAIAYYFDELGARHDVSYPLAPDTELPVVDGPDDDSDVSVTLTFWRPQRRPTSEAECAQPPQELCTQKEWIDIGHLGHFAKAPGVAPCPESSYSEVEQELVPSPGFPPNFPYFLLVDSVDDRAADPDNTFSYKLNLDDCLRGGTVGPAAPFNFAAALSPQSGQPNNIAESAYMFTPQP